VLLLACVTPQASLPSWLATRELDSCIAPAAAPRWSDQGSQLGLNIPELTDELEHSYGWGLAVQDTEGDGDLDILLARPGMSVLDYRNEGGYFTGSTLEGGNFTWGFSLGDIDNDGDLDAVASGVDRALFLNDSGSWTREDLPDPGFAIDAQASVRDYAIGDLNLDGALDLYAGVWAISEVPEANQDRFYWGKGDGSFEEDPSIIPIPLGDRRAFDVQWLDWNQDGAWEPYIANDFGELFGGNVLYLNEAGRLKDHSEGCFCDTVMNAMGADIGDANWDGHPELFLTGTYSDILLVSEEEGQWIESTQGQNAAVIPDMPEYFLMSWGALWWDADNNGRLDLLVTEGDLWGVSMDYPPIDRPLHLLWGSENGYQDDTESLAGLGSFRSVVTLDFNKDGILDVLASDAGAMPHLYLSEGCTDENWLEITGPPFSRVELDVEQPDGSTQTLTGWLTTESGYSASRLPMLHFGLGKSSQINSIRIQLQGGEWLSSSLDLSAPALLSIAP
jgi:hypothetical protein